VQIYCFVELWFYFLEVVSVVLVWFVVDRVYRKHAVQCYVIKNGDVHDLIVVRVDFGPRADLEVAVVGGRTKV